MNEPRPPAFAARDPADIHATSPAVDPTARVFSEGGPLAGRIPGYQPRVQQLEMAQAVAATLADYSVLVCEAGTGTGKTLAYLVPAVLSGGKIIISTGTRNLQDQLFHRDLPLVLQALGIQVKAALLKGRANYLCLQRLREVTLSGQSLDGALEADLAEIRTWAGLTRHGDTAELTSIPEDAPVWRHATSTADNCYGQECPAIADCHVLKARRRAIESDVLVVNHHLFFADMVLRQEGFGELLPGADAVILDEAHQLPDIATRFFGTSISSTQLIGLARDAETAYRIEAGDQPALPAAAGALRRAVQAFTGRLDSRESRVTWEELALRPGIKEAVEALNGALEALRVVLVQLAERGSLLDACQRRCDLHRARFAALARDPDPKGAPADSEWPGSDWGDTSPPDYEQTVPEVRWLERQARGFVWHASPLEVSSQMAERIHGQRCAWIMTSATLAVGGRLDHFSARIGAGEARHQVWGSPFDFERQALCYLPPGLPDPRSADYSNALLETICQVLAISEGRAFVLFTSHAAMEMAASRLRTRLEFPLFVQGDAPRSELLEQFRSTANAVLLGTHSFWEGVDVRGDALSCVIIDKLPFAPPSDPVLRARLERLRAQGREPFREHQLPQAVLTLKQGVGRLIRDTEDRGVVVLCDPRVAGKGYGKVFIKSLPPMPITRDLDDLIDFFSRG